jgi:hypothetical protein
MMTTPTKGENPDVPTQVFEQFLQALEDSGESVEIISHLREALLEDKTFTEPAMKKAVLGEEGPTK